MSEFEGELGKGPGDQNDQPEHASGDDLKKPMTEKQAEFDQLLLRAEGETLEPEIVVLLPD